MHGSKADESGHPGRRGLAVLALVGVVSVLAGCTSSGRAAPPQTTSAAGQQVTAGSAPQATPKTPAGAIPASSAKRHHKTPAPRPAWHPRAKQQHHLPSGTGDVINAAGAVLPNRARTPGAVNPDVTQATIGRTICVSGWTATVRPSSSVTTELKVTQLDSGYAYKGDHATSDYEEDHLISLELGGAPSDQRNLWPEPYSSREGARVKDQVENKLHALVCGHVISLATAQHAIATDWWAAYTTYGGTAYSAPPARRPVHHVTAPAPAATGNGATARCNDGTYSYAAHHQGACSHHGGVQVFFK